MNEREIFAGAVEKSTETERHAFLDAACGSDSALRQRVEGLLREQSGLGSFLESPAAAPYSPTVTERPITEAPGTMIGPYKLLEQIGEGGFGVVFMAEQSAPVKRKVALKVIKPGMDTREVIARFEAERQALALMDHPNIAKVFDAGTTETGRPYFVMELVKGVPITDYCDQHLLTPKHRLELFVTVCQAVQHAHQKGIIHRDIKPSNVLVTLHDDKPVVKVIDFGIAKATSGQLTDKTLFTGFAQLVGTPLYMSPEQAALSAIDVDTRSDIYSLGVLLYELLTGTTPFDKTRLQAAAFDEVRRIIREEEPQKPSTRLSELSRSSLPGWTSRKWDAPNHTGPARQAGPTSLASIAAVRKTEPRKLSQLVRGDLDWIVMKALEKDRARRYETANGFAHDILHYLADEPVLACPPSAAYRFKKFTRRNRVTLAVSSVVLAALMLVIGVSGWTLRDRAAREQQAVQERARRQARVAEQVELALIEAQQSRERALALTGEPHQWEAALSAARSALMSATGIAAQGEQALPLELRSRIDGLRSALDDDEQDRQFAARFDSIRLAQSDLNPAMYSFRLDSAYPGVRAALQDFYQIQVGSTPIDEARTTVHSRPRAVQQIVWASLEVALANAPNGDTLAQEWLKEVLAAVDDAPWRQRARNAIDAGDWDSLQALVAELSQAREPAADLLRLADRSPADSPQRLTMLERIRREYPGDFWANYQLAVSLAEQSPPRVEDATRYLTAAMALRPTSSGAALKLGELLLSRGKNDAALDVIRDAVHLDPDYDYGHMTIGLALLSLNRLDEAETEMRRAIDLRPDFPGGYLGLGMVLMRQGQHADAEELLKTSVTRGPDYYWCHFHLGNLLFETARPAEAEAEFQKATLLDPRIAMGHFWLGRALEAQEKLNEAETCYLEAIRRQPGYFEAHRALAAVRQTRGTAAQDESLLRASPEQMPDDDDVQLQRALLLTSDGRLAEAETILRDAVRQHPEESALYYEWANVLVSLKRPAEAEVAFRETIRLNPAAEWLHASFAWFLRDQNQLQQAEEEFREAIRLVPAHSTTHYGLATVLHRQQKFAAAEEECITALRMEPNNFHARTELGQLYLDQQRWSDAEVAMRAALSLHFEENSERFASRIHYMLGSALSQQNRLSEAEGPLREAVNIDPEYDIAHDALGWLLLKQGEFAEAEAQFRDVMRLKPQRVSAYHGLGKTLVEQGRYEEAETCLLEALRLQPDNKHVPSLLKRARDGQRRSAEGAQQPFVEIGSDADP